MSETSNTITTFKDAVKDFALTNASQMAQYAEKVTNSWDHLEFPTFDFVPPWIGGHVNSQKAPVAPDISSLGTADAPKALSLDKIYPITLDPLPVFSVTLPVVNIPAAPSASLPNAPGNAPTFTAPTLPVSPAFTLPPVPTLENIALPPCPAINLPTFSTSLPVGDIVEPSYNFSFAEKPYNDALLDELKLKLMNDLVNGGYGIEPADEAALWERARERELLGGEENIQRAVAQNAALNFKIPTGAAMAAIQKAQQEALAKISIANRDIALKRSELYVQNRQFTIQQTKEVEQMLLQYWGGVMERALNAARALVELGVAVYNAHLAKAQYALERFRVAESAFEIQVRAALANLEVYKGQVEGARLAVDMQRLHTEIYKTQIDSVLSAASIYRTQMEGAKLQAEIEQLKLGAFRQQVETYVAQVGAKTAEFGMYESRLKGEMSKVQVYQTQVSAYGAQVEAYKSKAQAGMLQLESQIEPMKLELAKYETDLRRYTVEIQRSQQAAALALQKFDGQVRVYTAEEEISIKDMELGLAMLKSNSDITLQAAKVSSDVAIARGNISLGAANAMGQVTGGLAANYGHVASAAIAAAGSLTAQIESK